MPPNVAVSADATDLLGERAAAQLRDGDAPAHYICAACGRPGRLAGTSGARRPACAVATRYPTMTEVSLTHWHCGPSRVLQPALPPIAQETTADGGCCWYRPGSDPPAAVVAAVHVRALHDLHDGTGLLDRYAARLLAHGFSLLTDLSQPIVHVLRLDAMLSAPLVRFWTPDGASPFGRVCAGCTRPWLNAARETKRIGLVTATTIDFDAVSDPTIDPDTVLGHAIRTGHVVAGTARLALDADHDH